MKKLKKNRDQTSAQLLEGDVLVPHLTVKEQALSLEKEAIVVLMFMLVGLSKNVLSKDKWELSMWSAMADCEKVGINKERFNELYGSASKILERIRKSNPMSSMF